MDTVTVILLDFSGSMQGKMQSVKRILLKEVFPTMNYSNRIGLFLFRTLGKKSDVVEKQIPLDVISRQTLEEKVNALGKPNGGTPIAAAIKSAVNALKEYRALDKRIILVTDGQETGGGDYIKEAKDARADGIECEIHIIGLALENQAAIQAKEIARISKGSFSNIQSGQYNPAANEFSEFKKAIKQSRERVNYQASTTASAPQNKKNPYSKQNDTGTATSNQFQEKQPSSTPVEKDDVINEIESILDDTGNDELEVV